MNAFVQISSPNGQVREPQALDKPGGEAAPAPREYKSPLDGIEEGLRADQLESLGWLRRYGMSIAERLDRHTQGLLLYKECWQEPFKDVDVALAYSRIAKAVRQIVVLEQETAGVREMRVPRAPVERAAATEAEAQEREAPKQEVPTQEIHEPEADAPMPCAADRDVEDEDIDLRDGDDIDDYDDYRTGTVDEIVAEVRADLDRISGADRVARQVAEMLADSPAVMAAPVEPVDDDAPASEAAPPVTGEEKRRVLLAARIKALEARYGSTGPP